MGSIRNIKRRVKRRLQKKQPAVESPLLVDETIMEDNFLTRALIKIVSDNKS